MPFSLPDSFWDRVEQPGSDACWPWRSYLNHSGYGTFAVKQEDGRYRKHLAHRLAYEALVGPITEGLVIDHLCRNRSCCNPKHMEPVTIGENVMRGDTLTARYSKRTHCSKGHELTSENLRRRSGQKGRGRECLTCHNERNRMRRVAKADV